ncbi:hypothetical protein HK405_008131 [Cladochytrium tenue]|nr:hypothetical protein HK405_008131 [Cladochytrium tenue]
MIKALSSISPYEIDEVDGNEWDATPDAKERQAEASEQQAWNLASKLIREIEVLTQQIVDLRNSPGSQEPSGSLPVLAQAPDRAREILSAAPVSVALYLKRHGLIVTAFDQIRTIALPALSQLLDGLRAVMLFGKTTAEDRGNDDVQSIGPVRGVGLESDPDKAEIWKMLYNAVSYAPLGKNQIGPGTEHFGGIHCRSIEIGTNTTWKSTSREGERPNFKDPWARREAWRSTPYFSASRRFLSLTPGLGVASVIFSVYLAYDYWYQHEGPGREEKEKWDRWMQEREKRLAAESHGGHH